MALGYYQEYIRYARLGLRAEARKSILRFVESLSSFADKQAWTYANLLTVDRNGASSVRHEIYDLIAFPVLLDGYKRRDPECCFLMGMSYQNLLNYMGRLDGIEFVSRVELLKTAYFAVPTSQKYRQALLEALLQDFTYCDHEWPSGILGYSYPFENLKQEVKLAKKLDEERLFCDRLAEFSERIEQS
ncbi:hypothetical protein DI396_09385 [Litorivita pollutaquae]|uniref:Uncharacterized protein n=1 Tax=Litorivita pollutaquae TaxID=2200892 RepID=A0A2V4N142_9RHOB|nr:hypothetical protein [Litorivita pollutaquae]PYC47642.1 hypothetical protein DI396_09385 [Litorivita pollutaquae]